MDTIIPRSYQDFQPSVELVQGEAVDTLVINLPGFRKDQVKVQADMFEIRMGCQTDKFGILKVSGERLIGDNKWGRFRQDFPIPNSYNADGIRANIETGVLRIRMPKIITQVDEQDHDIPTHVAPQNQTLILEPQNQTLIVEPKPIPIPQTPPKSDPKSDNEQEEEEEEEEEEEDINNQKATTITSVKKQNSRRLVMKVVVATLVVGVVVMGAFYTIGNPGKNWKQGLVM